MDDQDLETKFPESLVVPYLFTFCALYFLTRKRYFFAHAKCVIGGLFAPGLWTSFFYRVPKGQQSHLTILSGYTMEQLLL